MRLCALLTYVHTLLILLKLINYSCSQKPINDLHLIPNETPDETPPGFHLR